MLRQIAAAVLMVFATSSVAAQDQLVDPNTVRPSREAGRTANGPR
jgi:alpha-galactosidase